MKYINKLYKLYMNKIIYKCNHTNKKIIIHV